MARISAFFALLMISGVLLSDPFVNGQATASETVPDTTSVGTTTRVESTTVGTTVARKSDAETTTRVESTTVGTTLPRSDAETTTRVESTTVGTTVARKSDACPSHAEAGQASCGSISGIDDLNRLLSSGDAFELCSFSMQVYACAEVGKIPPDMTFNIMQCFLTDQAVITQQSVALFLNKISDTNLKYALNKMSELNLDVPPQTKYFILNGVIERLSQDLQVQSPSALKAWFHDLLFFINEIDDTILHCLLSFQMTCEGLQSIATVLNLDYDSMENETSSHIADFICLFIASHDCQMGTIPSTLTYYLKKFINHATFQMMQKAYVGKDMSTVVAILNEVQLAQYVKATNAFSNYISATAVIERLLNNNFFFGYNFLKSLPMGDYSFDILFSLSVGIMRKLEAVDDPLCKPQIKAIFQGEFNYIFQCVNETLLDIIKMKDCSDIKDIFTGFDDIYTLLSSEQKVLLAQYRLKNLKEEATRTGSGCTYGYTSLTWVQNMLGRSLEFIPYSDLLILNPNFDGYQALDLLTVAQIVDMITYTKLFTDASPSSADMRVDALIAHFRIKGFDGLKRFQVALKEQNFTVISNAQVRQRFLVGIWEIIKIQFVKFTADDWNIWFNELLVMCLPSITADLLETLPSDVVKGCSNMQKIVQGFSTGFSYMSDSSAQGVTNWITSLLTAQTDHCTEGDADWLLLNYGAFHAQVSVTVIQTMNPSYLDGHLEALSSSQFGEYVIYYTPAHTNTQIIQNIFAIIRNGTHEQNMEKLSMFWDSYSVTHAKADNISVEVKKLMLLDTCKELSVSFSTFTAEMVTSWFGKKLHYVLYVIDEEMLNLFPVDPGCDFHKSFVKATSSVYGETLLSSKLAISGYLKRVMDYDKNSKPQGKKCVEKETSTVSYITDNWGGYSLFISYEVIITYFPTFNPLEPGVFKMLTTEQIGEMMVVSKFYENTQSVTTLFEYIKTQDVSYADEVMTSFTNKCIERNIYNIDVSVAHLILKHYMSIIQTNIATYSLEELKMLFSTRLYILMPDFNTETLSRIYMKDCDSLTQVVTVMDKSYSRMSAATRKVVVSWILTNLQSNPLSGCKEVSASSNVWIRATMKQFFMDTTLSQVQQVYSLNVMEVIAMTSESQKAEYLTSTNALTNVTTTMTVLETLVEKDISVTVERCYMFLSEFNMYYSKLTVHSMTAEVQLSVLTFTFDILVVNINILTSEKISQFQTLFQYFMPAITIDLIVKIPLNMDCRTSQYIFGAINSVYGQLSDSTRTAASQKILDFLANSNAPGDSPAVCNMLYTDSRTYIKNIYFSFGWLIPVYYFEMYYSQFDVYGCLDLLSGTQLGSLLINTTAITNELQASLIIAEVQKRSYVEVKSCVMEVNRLAQAKGIDVLPDANIQRLLHNVVWAILYKSLGTAEDYDFWFGQGQYNLMMSAISAIEIESISDNTGCSSQKDIVKSFSAVYRLLNNDQKSAVFKRIKTVNTKIQKNTGSACPTVSGTSGAWLKDTFGAFEEMATLQEIKELNTNFSVESVLPSLSGPQLADYTMESRALSSVEIISGIMDSITTSEQMGYYLDQLNAKAGVTLQSSQVGSLILGKCFILFSPKFPTFKLDDWTNLFNTRLKYILHYITVVQLDLISLPMDCTVFQNLVSAFSYVFDSMSEVTQGNLYENFIKHQLNLVTAESGMRCGVPTDTSETWMQKNTGKFEIYANVTDLKKWNTKFNALSVVNSLGPVQLAEVAILVIDNEEAACQVAGRLQQYSASSAYSFMGAFSSSFAQINKQAASKPAVQKLISSVFKAISLATYTSTQWQELVNVVLEPLYSFMDQEQLTSLISSADCNSYASIVSKLNQNFGDYTPDVRQRLFTVLSDHIMKKKGDSGFCPEQGEASSSTIERTLGKFSVFCENSQFDAIKPGFDWLNATQYLSPQQLANYTYSSAVLSNMDQAEILNKRLSKLDAGALFLYLEASKVAADEKNIQMLPNKSIQIMLLTTFTTILSPQYISFTTNQWNQFILYCGPFLSVVQEFQVKEIPDNIGCMALEYIVAGFSSHFEELSGAAQVAITKKIKAILGVQKSSTQSPCLGNINSAKWIEKYWGYFSELEELYTFYSLYPPFSVLEALAYLTPEQLASYMADASVLLDLNKVDKVLTAIQSSNMGFFLNAFNTDMKTKGISGISNVQVKRFFLGSVFCKATSIFPSFTQAEYLNFFTSDLEFLLSSIDAKCFGFLPTVIDCNSLANIMGAIHAVKNLEYPKAAYDFIQSRLSSAENSCIGNLDSRAWVQTYIGPLLPLAKYGDIIALNPNFDAAACTDLMSSSQLAEALSGSTIMYNTTALTLMLESASRDVKAFATFVDTLKTSLVMNPSLTLNNKMKEFMFSFVAVNVFSRFSDMPSMDVQHWMNRISFLTSSLNATFLEYIPSTIPCDNFAVVVSVLDSESPYFTEQKKKDIAGFILNILNAKATSSEGACTTGVTLIQWVMKYLASYCLNVSADQLTLIFPGIDSVSYMAVRTAYSSASTSIPLPMLP